MTIFLNKSGIFLGNMKLVGKIKVVARYCPPTRGYLADLDSKIDMNYNPCESSVIIDLARNSVEHFRESLKFIGKSNHEINVAIQAEHPGFFCKK